MENHRQITIALLCLLSVATLRACNPDPPVGSRSLSLVPASSTVVLELKWAEVVSDRELTVMMQAGEIVAFLRQLGIADKQVVNLTAFAQIQEQKELTAAIIKGIFNVKRVLVHLKQTGWQEVESGFYQKEDTKEWVVPLGRGLLAFGNPEALKWMLEVRGGRQKSAYQDTTWSLLLQGLTPAPVRMGLILPQHLRDMGTFGLEAAGALLDMAKLGPLGKLMTQIGMAEGLCMSISHSGQFFPTELVALMGSVRAAQLASGALNLLKAMAGLLPKEQIQSQGAESLESFKQMVVSRHGRLLRIKMVIPRNEMMRTY